MTYRRGRATNLAASLLLATALTTAAATAQQAPTPPAPPASDFGLLNAHHPAEGVLFGGQPDSGQLQAMARAGFATVLDLRGEGEERGYDEAGLAQSLGMVYRRLPISSTTLQSPATFTAFFQAFEKAQRPVVVHCAVGSRVGALYYAYLVAIEGMERSAALAEARQQGLRSDALVEVVDEYLDR